MLKNTLDIAEGCLISIQWWLMLNKQVYIGLVSFAEITGHTGEFHAVDEFFPAYTHYIHRHGAGHDLYAQHLRGGNEFWQGVDIFSLHHVFHHSNEPPGLLPNARQPKSRRAQFYYCR